MDCKNLEDPSLRLKAPAKSTMRIGHSDGRPVPFSHGPSASQSNTANNTSPIVCAVCGSKEYITVHSQEKHSYPFGASMGWNASELLKKGPLSMDFAQTCGPLSPIAQAIFPQLSLFQLPPNLYYSQYNPSFRFPSTPCVPIEKYFGDGNMELDTSKAPTINSESTLYRETKDAASKKSPAARLKREVPFRKEDSGSFKTVNDESRPTSAFTSRSDVRNYPLAVHSPWMGNICPIFPYTYASLAFPLNHPLIPIYLPMPGKWQNADSHNEDENVNSSASNSPMGDSGSVKNDEDKKFGAKDENNTSDYDFDVFARELMLEQKSNYDEDEEDEVEINLDEITSSLKISDVTSSSREINSEKFFNSKEKWMESAKDGCSEKDEIQNWRLPSEINMQDCCIRTLSNENLWYEAQDGDKKNWESSQDYEAKDGGFKVGAKDRADGVNSRVEEKEKIGDGVFYEANTVWTQDRKRPDDVEVKSRTNWKKTTDKTPRKHKVGFGESSDVSDKKTEWSNMSKSEPNDEIEFSRDKISPLPDSARLRDLKITNDQTSKLDVRFNDYREDNEGTTQSEKIKNECKSSGLAQHISSSTLNTSVINKMKRDEKPRSNGMQSSKFDSLKIPVPATRKIRKQDDLRKRWLT